MIKSINPNYVHTYCISGIKRYNFSDIHNSVNSFQSNQEYIEKVAKSRKKSIDK